MCMKKLLKTDADFDNAILFGLHVSVWQGDHIIDYGGRVEYHSQLSVTINGAKYLKDNCQFHVK